MKSTPTILIAEDNGLISEHLLKYIEQQEIKVLDIVSTIAETNRIMKEKYPDIILINIKLLDAKVNQKLLRHLKSISDVPIIILTGYKRKMIPNTFFDFEQIYFLQKPFSNYQLKTVLQDALNLQL